ARPTRTVAPNWYARLPAGTAETLTSSAAATSTLLVADPLAPVVLVRVDVTVKPYVPTAAPVADVSEKLELPDAPGARSTPGTPNIGVQPLGTIAPKTKCGV